MSALSHFHFDRDPFPTNGENNYFYENRRQTRIIADIAEASRANAGVWAITGGDGAGKTTVLKRIAQEVGNNDFAAMLSAGGRFDLMRETAVRLGLDGRRKMDVSDILNGLDKLYRRGRNIMLIIDDAHEMTEHQAAALAALASSLPFIRIVLAGAPAMPKKLFGNKNLPQLKERLVGKYRLRPLSFFQGIGYVSRLATDALSLAQYRKAIGFVPAMWISFAANRNMRAMNLVATRAIEDAYSEGLGHVRARNVFHAIRREFPAARENIYIKFQEIFIGLVLLFCAYFIAKMAIDRHSLIEEIEVHKSLSEQEKLIQGTEAEQ
ncbi:MAG: AAA family ATPase [Rickettsiales bacterium]|jgi:type II secretory pathway predicted ATPase ExeA|nr:AAA family ATPase [Rickettsiales bacterium]